MPAPVVVPDGDDLRVTFPEWRPRTPAHRVVPALSALGECPRGFRFEISGCAAGTWSPWIAGATVGQARFAEGVTRSETLVCEIDEFIANPPAERIRLVLRASTDGAGSSLGARWCASLSAWSPGSETRLEAGGARLVVPAFSQMEEDTAIRHRVCSPTCVAMVLGHLSQPAGRSPRR